MRILNASSNVYPQLIEHIGRQNWRVRWNITESTQTDEETQKETTTYNYVEAEFDHLPTAEEVQEVITDWFNEDIDKQIISGHTWNNYAVWLSSENQFNYKAAYDIAVQTNGANLPITFKLGNTPATYYNFTTLEELTDFYMSCLNHIQSVLLQGWQKKEEFSQVPYVTILNEE